MKTNRERKVVSAVPKGMEKGVAVQLAVAVCMVLLMVIVWPFSAQAARERFVLDFDDAHIRGHQGEPVTIFLRKAFHEQYPRVELRDMDLQKVVLVAKSKRGKGRAHLRVGEWRTDSYAVAGRPVDFRDGRKITFDRVRFHNPSHGSYGPWQIDLQGNFIVRKVVLELDNYRYHHRYYGRKHHYNKHRFQKRYYSQW